MSAVKTNKVQIGQSATPGNNITIECPAVPDGSFSIRQGAHDGSGVVLLSVDASGNPTFPTQTPRTWQSMIASRAVTTVYTNNTGRDIELTITTALSGTTRSSVSLTKGVSSVLFSGSFVATAGQSSTISVTVPDGWSYSLNESFVSSIIEWNELRP